MLSILLVLGALIGIPLVHFNVPSPPRKPGWMSGERRFTWGWMIQFSLIVIAIFAIVLALDTWTYEENLVNLSTCDSNITRIKYEMYGLSEKQEPDLQDFEDKTDALKSEISTRDGYARQINRSRKLWSYNPFVAFRSGHLGAVEILGKSRLESIFRELKIFREGQRQIEKVMNRKGNSTVQPAESSH